MTRVAVIGSTGQLGSDLVRVLREANAYDVIPLSHADIECTDPVSVGAAVEAARPDVAVNCAGYVRVDDCEERVDKAFRVNASGALHVARACDAVAATCVYVSSDYVFDGEQGRPYTEDDAPCPVNVYGASKLAGEHLVRQGAGRWLIVRLASLYGAAGARGKGGNFVEAILAKAAAGQTLKVVAETRMSPVYAVDAARALEDLIRRRAVGLFHVTNAGACSWCEFAQQTLDFAGYRLRVEPIPSSAYPTKARRPRDSTLATARRWGSREPWARPWQEALRAYLIETGRAGAASRERSP